MPEQFGKRRLKRDAAKEERECGGLDVGEIEDVFFGAEQGIGAGGGGAAGKVVNGLLRVAMVVGERDFSDDIEAPAAEVV